MRQEELRKGDWVWFITNQMPCQITEIYTTLGIESKPMVALSEHGKRYCVTMDDIRPIPLTIEILSDSGFEVWDHSTNHQTCWMTYGEDGNDDIEVKFSANGIHLKMDVVGTYLSTSMITTVHQLQHVFEDHHIDVKLIVKR